MFQYLHNLTYHQLKKNHKQLTALQIVQMFQHVTKAKRKN